MTSSRTRRNSLLISIFDVASCCATANGLLPPWHRDAGRRYTRKFQLAARCNYIFDDVWHRVKSSNYDHCRINIEVGPAALDYEEALWDRTALQSEWRYCACEPCGPAWFPQGSLVPQGLGWPRSRRPMAVVRCIGPRGAHGWTREFTVRLRICAIRRGHP